MVRLKRTQSGSLGCVVPQLDRPVSRAADEDSGMVRVPLH